MGVKSFSEYEKKEHSLEGAPHLQSRSKACSFSSLLPTRNAAAKKMYFCKNFGDAATICVLSTGFLLPMP